MSKFETSSKTALEESLRELKTKFIRVEQAKIEIATPSHIFRTDGVGPCSVYAFLGSNSKSAGLYHAPPYPEISEDLFYDVRNGYCLPIHTAQSRPKPEFEAFLRSQLNIKILNQIQSNSRIIDVFFVPFTNMVFTVDPQIEVVKQFAFIP